MSSVFEDEDERLHPNTAAQWAEGRPPPRATFLAVSSFAPRRPDDEVVGETSTAAMAHQTNRRLNPPNATASSATTSTVTTTMTSTSQKLSAKQRLRLELALCADDDDDDGGDEATTTDGNTTGGDRVVRSGSELSFGERYLQACGSWRPGQPLRPGARATPYVPRIVGGFSTSAKAKVDVGALTVGDIVVCTAHLRVGSSSAAASGGAEPRDPRTLHGGGTKHNSSGGVVASFDVGASTSGTSDDDDEAPATASSSAGETPFPLLPGVASTTDTTAAVCRQQPKAAAAAGPITIDDSTALTLTPTPSSHDVDHRTVGVIRRTDATHVDVEFADGKRVKLERAQLRPAGEVERLLFNTLLVGRRTIDSQSSSKGLLGVKRPRVITP